MFNHCDMETINMYACVKVSLGGNIRNITLSFSYTHQPLRKYRKHLKMGFHYFFKCLKIKRNKNILNFSVPNHFLTIIFRLF